MANHPWTIAPCGGIRLDKDSFEIRFENNDEKKPYIAVIGGGGGGEPAQYLKEAELQADGSLKITKKDGSTITFADGGYVKNVTATADKIKVTKQDGTVVELDKLPASYIKDVVVSDDGKTLKATKKDGTIVSFSGGEPDAYLKSVAFDATTGKMTFTKKDGTTQEFQTSPTEYVKKIDVDETNNKITITKQDGTTATFDANPTEYVKKITYTPATNDLKYTDETGEHTINVAPAEYIKKAVVNDDGDLVITKQDGTTTTYVAGLPEHYVSAIAYTPSTNTFKYTNETGDVTITIEPEQYIKKVEKTSEKVTFTNKNNGIVELEFVSPTDLEAYLDARA